MNKTLETYIENQHENALRAYIAECGEAGELLANLSAYVDDHGEVLPDDVNWTHVGTMAHLVELLHEAKAYIRGEEA